jgi:hypothetical protein
MKNWSLILAFLSRSILFLDHCLREEGRALTNHTAKTPEDSLLFLFLFPDLQALLMGPSLAPLPSGSHPSQEILPMKVTQPISLYLS